MTILAYCKGLPTPMDELTHLGLTDFELFLFDYSAISYRATVETVNHLLDREGKLDKSKWNTHLQKAYGISKRHAGGIIAHSEGKVSSAKECRIRHIKQLESQLKSARQWVSKAEKKVKLARKFYVNKNWQNSKNGCIFPLAISLESKKTNWHQLKFNIHHKQRYIHKVAQQIKCLKAARVRVKVSRSEVFIVGSKDESYGNQVCQWDGNIIKFRVPYSLESKYGKYVESKIGNFDRKINRLPELGAKTWHFYRKDYRWVVALLFTPAPVERVSRPIQYGCIGIDMNPGVRIVG